MSAYPINQFGRILVSSVIVMALGCPLLGGDKQKTPLPKKPSQTAKPLPDEQPILPLERQVAEDNEILPAEAPKELPLAKDADRPSPLRLEVTAPVTKPKTTTPPKVLTFKPEGDSSGMATRLKASASSGEKSGTFALDASHDQTGKNATSKEKTKAEGDLPGSDDPAFLEEDHPIAPPDAPGATASDQDEPASSEYTLEPQAETDGTAMQPVPDFEESGPASLEAASFNGVTPGVTTQEEVEKTWGPPKEIYKQNDRMTQLYSIEPFDRIEIGYEKDTVVSVVVRFQKLFPADRIAQQLDMAAMRPVLISSDMGEILGQAYPERGVLFAFDPGENPKKPSYKVSHIMLEPLAAEPFVLRAETMFERRYDRSLQDLGIALELQPDNARAHWLLGRVYAAMEQYEKAEESSAEAVKLDPKNVRYGITHGQILGQMGRIQEALREVQTSIENSAEQPHLKARALCLKGDLIASGSKPDYRKAIGYHGQALNLADKASYDEHPAVRRTAKEVLIDAHLGSAHDIAWGDWKDKEKAVAIWLKRAAAIAEDLVRNEEGNTEQLFRVNTRALSALVGVRSGVDPKPWLDEALRTGNESIAETKDPVRKAQFQWDLGMALYDAVQICQLKANHALALQYGEAACGYLEQGYASKQTPTTGYVLGRLYFRLGAIRAIRDQDHPAAVGWFEKAIPLLDKPVPTEAQADLGRYGETFVSMGVSYWETGNRNKAIELTLKGIKFMEEAVGQGMLDRTALVIPYTNLAAMQRQAGNQEEAARSAETAAKIKNSKTR